MGEWNNEIMVFLGVSGGFTPEIWYFQVVFSSVLFSPTYPTYPTYLHLHFYLHILYIHNYIGRLWEFKPVYGRSGGLNNPSWTQPQQLNLC